MPKVTSWYRHKRRQQIIDAAMTCFVRDGFHQTTMQAICREAQLSSGGLYRYFASKEDIIQAAAEQRQRKRAVMQDAICQMNSPLAAIDERLASIFDTLEAPQPGAGMEVRLRPQIWAEAFRSERVHTILHQSWANVLATNLELVAAAQESGDIDQGFDAEAVALVMLAVVDGLTLHKAIDSDLDVRKVGEVFRAMCSGTFPHGARADGEDVSDETWEQSTRHS